MSQKGHEYEEVADRAVRISELIEEIILLDDLIELHELNKASEIEKQQYIDRRAEFIEGLNSLLNPHHLRIVIEDQRA